MAEPDYDCYDGVPPHEDSQDTSAIAAVLAMPNVSKLQRKVLAHIAARKWHGATDDELEVALKLSHQTVSARRRELVMKGLLRNSGRTRRTRRDRLAVVWELGLELVEQGKDTPALYVPTKEEMRLGIDGLYAALQHAKKHGHRFTNTEEMGKLGAWLKAISR